MIEVNMTRVEMFLFLNFFCMFKEMIPLFTGDFSFIMERRRGFIHDYFLFFYFNFLFNQDYKSVNNLFVSI